MQRGLQVGIDTTAPHSHAHLPLQYSPCTITNLNLYAQTRAWISWLAACRLCSFEACGIPCCQATGRYFVLHSACIEVYLSVGANIACLGVVAVCGFCCMQLAPNFSRWAEPACSGGCWCWPEVLQMDSNACTRPCACCSIVPGPRAKTITCNHQQM
jgi:hypothetical protein